MADNKMDSECIELCDAINLLPGLKTTESCCGHGTEKYYIWFVADNLKSLPDLCYFFKTYSEGRKNRWNVSVQVGDYPVQSDPARHCFMIEGPIGEGAYADAKIIADLISTWIAVCKTQEWME